MTDKPPFTRHQATRNPGRLAALDAPRAVLYATVAKLDGAALNGDLETLELAILETESAMRELLQRVTELDKGRVVIGETDNDDPEDSIHYQLTEMLSGWLAITKGIIEHRLYVEHEDKFGEYHIRGDISLRGKRHPFTYMIKDTDLATIPENQQMQHLFEGIKEKLETLINEVNNA